jgi:hypothetical protein
MNKVLLKTKGGGTNTAKALLAHMERFEMDIFHCSHKCVCLRKMNIVYNGEGQTYLHAVASRFDEDDATSSLLDWAMTTTSDELLLPVFGITRKELIDAINRDLV